LLSDAQSADRIFFESNMTKTLRWLFFVQLVSMGAMEMSAPFWAQHFQQLGTLSPTELAWASGLAYAGPMLMTMLLSPLWGKVGDRVGHKLMLVRALLALTLTQCWIAWSNDVTNILLARLVQGALAGFIATSQAYGSTLLNKEQRGRLMAHLQTATALGSVLGPMIGGYVYSGMGFNQVNWIAAVLCAISMVATLCCLPPVSTNRKESALANIIKSSTDTALLSPIAGLLLAIILVQSAKMMPQIFFSLYVEQILDASPWLTGLCYGATALGLCLAASYWARRFARISRQQIMREIEYCCWICALLLGVQATSDNLWVFVLSRVIWGVFLAALLPVFYTLLSQDTSSSQQGWVLGLGNSAAKAGALLGMLIGSVGLAYLPIENLFWPVSGVYMVSALVIRFQRLPSLVGRARFCAHPTKVTKGS
jgi:MFS transporter, DHA1 family, staphyloferrin B biosynthesis exporter